MTKITLRFILTAVLITTACSVLTSCHKQCACLHNNGTITYYSKSDVEDANGGNCSNMKYQSGVEYYVACDWEK